ncbi:hypothetical protein K438DRAFT_1974381 [Mycena galopus ATCC 62051]|nr:hypothetical protein K438DRAFT_1974381 [Mycena galopus ATCC 62051]
MRIAPFLHIATFQAFHTVRRGDRYNLTASPVNVSSEHGMLRSFVLEWEPTPECQPYPTLGSTLPSPAPEPHVHASLHDGSSLTHAAGQWRTLVPAPSVTRRSASHIRITCQGPAYLVVASMGSKSRIHL